MAILEMSRCDNPSTHGDRHALFVAFSVPENRIRSATGFHRRQRLLIDAIKMVSDRIDVLLYVQPAPQATSETNRHEIETRLNELWEGRFHVTLCSRGESPSGHSWWQRYFKPAVSFFSQAGFSSLSSPLQVSALDTCLKRRPDFVFVHRLLCMGPVLLTKEKLPPVFLDMDDVEHIAFIRGIKQPPTWASKRFEYLQVPALMYGELRAIKRSTATLVCSDTDRTRLQRLYWSNRVVTVPNAVTVRQKEVPLSTAETMLLLGDYSYGPNRVGAEFFLSEVWPLIIAAVPGARITIAGLRSELISQSAALPMGVEFPGFVADLDELYAGTRVVVCPILSGGGTRVKIMEAAAYGKPIVSTTVGAEGIDLVSGSEILRRDSPADFADGCIQLLRDHSLATKVGRNAAQAIETNYERSKVLNQLGAVLMNSVPNLRKL